MFCITKRKIYPAYLSKYSSNPGKKVVFFLDTKRKTMVLYCSKKITYIVRRNNIKTPRFELLSFFCNKKHTSNT